MNKTITVILFLGICCGALFTASATNNNGIHIISTNAVYLEGESCTVNMHSKRTTEAVKRDLEGCYMLHETFSK